MCGVIGLIGKESIGFDLLAGLQRLEHRGRFSSGIITAHNQKFGVIERGEGSVREVFGDIDLDSIIERVGIGHTRYPTSANPQKSQGQPLYLTFPGMAMAHNGQIINHLQLKEKLEKIGYSIATDSDSEVLMYAFAQNILKQGIKGQQTPEYVDKVLFPALELLLTPGNEFSIEGSASVVTLIPQHGLLAFKDSRGIRPLVFAKKGDTYGFASESVALSTLDGFTNREELKAGEAIFIDHNLNIYRKIIHDAGEKSCKFERVYFGKAESWYGNHTNEVHRENLGHALAREYAQYKDKVDVIIDVPKTPIPAANVLARLWDKPHGGIHADSTKRTFLATTQQQRELLARRKFSFNEEYIKDQRIALIDDSIVRGTNSKIVVESLFALGAKEVHFFVTYPPFKGVCPYGIDVPNEEKLLFYNRTHEQACEFIGATSLNMLSLDATLNALGMKKEKTCLGCTTKKYPSDLSLYKTAQEARK